MDASGVEKKEEISTVSRSDSGPQVRLWAAETLQVGLWALELDFGCSWERPLCGHPEPGGGWPKHRDGLHPVLCPCLSLP